MKTRNPHNFYFAVLKVQIIFLFQNTTHNTSCTNMYLKESFLHVRKAIQFKDNQFILNFAFLPFTAAAAEKFYEQFQANLGLRFNAKKCPLHFSYCHHAKVNIIMQILLCPFFPQNVFADACNWVPGQNPPVTKSHHDKIPYDKFPSLTQFLLVKTFSKTTLLALIEINYINVAPMLPNVFFNFGNFQLFSYLIYFPYFPAILLLPSFVNW